MAYHGLDMVLILFSNSLLAVLDLLSILFVYVLLLYEEILKHNF
jgi:hypothetical protein